jgi:hypothetical protein
MISPSPQNFEDDFEIKPDTQEHGTYEELKEAVRRSGGDAAREWMSGATTTGSAVYKAVKKTKDETVETMKRGLEEGIGRPEPSVKAPAKPHFPRPADSRSFFTSAAAYEGESVGDKVKESMNRAADALEGGMASAKDKISEAVGGGGDASQGSNASQAVNARAEWEASRSPEQRAAHNADRKSQLTDEAYGDNPAEATPRMDKDTVPDPLDTPH